MKSLLLTLTACLVAAVTSTAKASVTDFQSLITESIEAKKELSEKLVKKDSNRREKVVIHENHELPAENIVAPSKSMVTSADSLEAQTLKMDLKNLKRVSDELKDAQ